MHTTFPAAAAEASVGVRPDLFSPVHVGGFTLPNRVVMAPMTRDRTPGHVPNALNARYYAQRAAAGLIVTEGTAPHPMGNGYIDIPGIHTDEQAQGWRLVTDAVHQAGGRIFVQLMHVGRISHPSFLGGAAPLAPSAVKPEGTMFTADGPQPFVTPRAMTEAEIEEALEAFGTAARRAVEIAGADGVELHGANGYLPNQFLVPDVNRRDDRWGGSVEGRARFLLEAVDRMIAAVGGDRVGVRLSPGGTYNDIRHPDWPETYDYLIRELDRRPLAYLHVVTAAGPDVAPFARERFRGVLILNGGYDRARAEADIASGLADLVSFGVPFLANPDLPRRLEAGAALNTPDPDTFYSGGERGYLDYPVLEEAGTRAAALG